MILYVKRYNNNNKLKNGRSSSVPSALNPLLSDCAIACMVSALLPPPCSLICEVWKFRPALASPSLFTHALVLTRPVSSTKVPFVSSLATFAVIQ